MRKIEIEIPDNVHVGSSFFGLGMCELEPGGTGSLRITAHRSAVLTRLRLLVSGEELRVFVKGMSVAGVPLNNNGEVPIGAFKDGLELHDHRVGVAQEIRVDLVNTSKAKIAVSGAVEAFEIEFSLMQLIFDQLRAAGVFV